MRWIKIRRSTRRLWLPDETVIDLYVKGRDVAAVGFSVMQGNLAVIGHPTWQVWLPTEQVDRGFVLHLVGDIHRGYALSI
jgi:hypothetical protein